MGTKERFVPPSEEGSSIVWWTRDKVLTLRSWRLVSGTELKTLRNPDRRYSSRLTLKICYWLKTLVERPDSCTDPRLLPRDPLQVQLAFSNTSCSSGC